MMTLDVQERAAQRSAEPRRWPGSTSGRPLALILGLALLLRLTGINWGLPWAFHLDEPNYVERALEMVRTGDPNPGYFENPSFFIYVVSGALTAARALGPLAGPFDPDRPGGPHLVGRAASALSGVASVALLAASGAALFGRTVGLLAAALLAVCFLHVRDSHYAVNDVPATALLLLSFYGSARLLASPDRRWYLLAGLAGGLAMSTKYTMASFILPLLAAHVVASCRVRHGGARGTVLISPLLLAGAAALAAFLVGTPFAVLDAGQFIRDVAATSRTGAGGRWLGQPTDPVPLLYVATLLQGLGLAPLLATIAGAVVSWRSRRAACAVAGILPLCYLGFMATRSA
ncbi:MAG: glycosyltransferase family 39 protein, partial [Chloroflexi bacterium]|nr:glycosyltransferase family 39 protein [Chloroflexota bacterium]